MVIQRSFVKDNYCKERIEDNVCKCVFLLKINKKILVIKNKHEMNEVSYILSVIFVQFHYYTKFLFSKLTK